METRLCALEVRVHGRPVKEYHHHGEIWIEGRKGSEFTLRLSNRTGNRILMVPSIDGLSVMDGEEAAFDDRGYVVPAWGHVDVPGWRLNNDEVAKFKFGKSHNSYAAKTGKPRNIGVVGCAVFEEKRKHIRIKTTEAKMSYKGGQSRGGGMRYGSSGGGGTYTSNTMDIGDVEWEITTSGTADSYYGEPISGGSETYTNGTIPDVFNVNVADVEPSLGTEFGKKAGHKVQEVTFLKASDKPNEVITLRYGDRQELQQRGIDLSQKPQAAGPPDAFPAEGNCKPPVDWNG